MSSHRFWVVGGEYTDMRFAEVVDGTHRLFGPFAFHDEARRAWADRTAETRCQALVRFTIAQEGEARRGAADGEAQPVPSA
jgi:hypothetical protein